jgi:hypothetical protein
VDRRGPGRADARGHPIDRRSDRLPIVFFPDGSHLIAPGNRELAEKIGLQTKARLPFYDLVIVGAGPAGLAAAVYGASEGLRTVLLEQSAPGGQAGTSSKIENYLGFPSGISGGDLARRAGTQARRFGAEVWPRRQPPSTRIGTASCARPWNGHLLLLDYPRDRRLRADSTCQG